ncbi:MAG TPA: hypothetical protein VKV39_05835 [Candidatus Sulfotelmatobacter sp.]|nr:hypothetical protein [Candidatus Sulfotelmatobacter sp.]
MKNERALASIIGFAPLFILALLFWNPWGRASLILRIALIAVSAYVLFRNPFRESSRSSLILCAVYAISALAAALHFPYSGYFPDALWACALGGFAAGWGFRTMSLRSGCLSGKGTSFTRAD